MAYTNENINLAIERVRNGEISSYKASTLYNIPRTTIDNHVSGRSHGFKRGRPTFFTKEQEQVLYNYITLLSHYGSPPDRVTFKSIAREFAKRYEIQSKGSQWRPGEDWLNG
jgi:hypothetical protein